MGTGQTGGQGKTKPLATAIRKVSHEGNKRARENTEGGRGEPVSAEKLQGNMGRGTAKKKGRAQPKGPKAKGTTRRRIRKKGPINSKKKNVAGRKGWRLHSI